MNIIAQLLANHDERVRMGMDEAVSALGALNAFRRTPLEQILSHQIHTDTVAFDVLQKHHELVLGLATQGISEVATIPEPLRAESEAVVQFENALKHILERVAEIRAGR